ncbi:MAG: hypothetical protein ACFFD4_10875 [Candidatus Odinarchaeota archaeon]
MSQERLKEDNHADQDVNTMLKATLNKIVFNIGQQQQGDSITKKKEATFETKELMILNDAGLLVYRKSRIFSDMLAAIKRAIQGSDFRATDEPLVIRTEELTTIITRGNGFSIVIVGSGSQIDSIKPDAKLVCRVIAESGVMEQFSSLVSNMTTTEEAFLSLRSRMPRSFSEFFTGGN